uniref:Calponin-homology (CH) domain-containing protein n=1 Tax=Syphacia muris TaxID=451379 RepID=A0A0N5AEL1_9BILA
MDFCSLSLFTKGKLAASVKWLIGHVYGGLIPDLLASPICFNEDNTFYLVPAVVTALTNASLYSNAAAKVFKDQSLINVLKFFIKLFLQQSHSVVLWALSNHSIPLLISGEEANIDEAVLSSVKPFHQAAHLAVMDALMTAHMRSIITIERVVTAVQKYTTVDPREEPMDSVDALLFWINKICLLVRDDIEKMMTKRDDNQFGSIVVPEMEDLYEDMCDGACLCALVAFYSDQMNMQMKIVKCNIDFLFFYIMKFLLGICFNDPMSIPDCQYNLVLLKSFCEHLPFNFFYFEIEDILYLHECLQPNVNAFLADLFNYFESGDQSYAMSLMSTDSLVSNREGTMRGSDVGIRGNQLISGPDVTNFRQINQIPTDEKGRFMSTTLSNSSAYERSDSMPAASVRLALEEKRRDLEKKRLFENNLNEAERIQKQKNAFFALMHHVEKANESMSRPHGELGSVSQAESDASRQFSAVQEIDNLKKQVEKLSVQHEELSRQLHGDKRMSHAISQPAIHSDLPYVQDGQMMIDSYCAPSQCMVNSCVQSTRPSNYVLSYTGDPMLQPVISAQPYDSQQVFIEGYGMTPVLNNSLKSSHSPQVGNPMTVGASSSLSSYILRQQHSVSYPRPILASSPVSTIISPGQGQYTVQNNNTVAGPSSSNNNSFRLHQNNASSSRLDPPLELNNSLTNWGLTYKAGHMSRPQRRTWENGTFIKSEMDLINQPDVVPYLPSEQDQVCPGPSSGNIRRVYTETDQSQSKSQSCTINDDNSSFDACMEPMRRESGEQVVFHKLYLDASVDSIGQTNHHQSPPKDPASSPLVNTLVKQRQSTTGGSQFIVDDIGQERASSGITREMEAKREALLARTLRRREQIEQKVGEIEARNAERRQLELEKQEAAEQRKKERELNRQRAFEAYKKKKMDRELEMSSTQNGRGHSQPPTSRPKSSVDMSRSRTLQRPSRTQSSVGEGNGSSSARSTISSIAEPSLKLYSKYVPKSNRTIIINALQYSVFPGAVWDKQRNEVLSELAKNDSKHLLLLFKDQKCRYMGAYSWDQQSDTAHRIHGKGPTICHESMMFLMFKYDSGAKSFSQIPTKHLSATIDGFTLKDQFAQSARIPHSNSSYSGLR